MRHLGLGELEKVLTAFDAFGRDAKRVSKMIRGRHLAIGFLFAVIGTSPVLAADLSSYRGLQFGMDVMAAAKQTGTKATEARIVHQRPAMIEELNWQPRSPILADSVEADPVREALLCFLDGQLFRIEVTYDRFKVQGMTADDMVEAISRTYGAATKPKAEIKYHSNYAEVAAVLGRWQDSEYSYDLVRTGDHSSFALILYSKRLDALAQAAIVAAVRLEAQEKPQRELEKQKKQEEEERLNLEKARAVNKQNFRP